MERQPQTESKLNYKERHKLLKEVEGCLRWLQIQMVAAPQSVKEAFIPILSTLSVLQAGEVSDLEKTHLRRIVAVQSPVLKTLPEGIEGLPELREAIEQEAGLELTELEEVEVNSIKRNSAWHLAMSDASKLERLVQEADADSRD